MRRENIPRRQERLILADATQRFERLLVNHERIGHYLAIGDVVQTTGLNFSFDYAFYS
jgi:hypothetical protein